VAEAIHHHCTSPGEAARQNKVECVPFPAQSLRTQQEWPFNFFFFFLANSCIRTKSDKWISAGFFFVRATDKFRYNITFLERKKNLLFP
jgi:hypothetical protein